MRSPLIRKAAEPTLADPFSKRGALTLFYLLSAQERGSEPVEFSVNQLARRLDLSPGTVHRVVLALEHEGVIQPRGMRTSKRFTLKSSRDLLIQWLKAYRFQKKAKFRQFAVTDPRKFERMLTPLLESHKLTPALHLAARQVFHAGVTNLRTSEFYVSDWDRTMELAATLELQEEDRGYEVLLIDSYYPGVVERFNRAEDISVWRSAFALLTFLDLYSFPLRGREQAEALFRKTPALSRICRWSEIEDIS